MSASKIRYRNKSKGCAKSYKRGKLGGWRWAMGDGRWAMGDGRWASQIDYKSLTMSNSCFFSWLFL
ncbi:hypothetical protein RJ45_08565 [Photobacterium gaetbulicola]|uniref:Uncharacterized protein n=1 Tax=Photobacterium gaetbulicola TaxID=1295392 RepID=A0A0B9G694_9GAMM|nr:hypothetical protein RJ45_08565 [Photobacterium gaetbulicola]